jgi:Complex I intermediate-associated protein 30 (CIA30)
VHVRTADCGWYDDSYRYTFLAKDSWQTVRIPWGEFQPNSVRVPLNSSRLNRISILGWMREFQADIALARIALYN